MGKHAQQVVLTVPASICRACPSFSFSAFHTRISMISIKHVAGMGSFGSSFPGLSPWCFDPRIRLCAARRPSVCGTWATPRCWPRRRRGSGTGTRWCGAPASLRPPGASEGPACCFFFCLFSNMYIYIYIKLWVWKQPKMRLAAWCCGMERVIPLSEGTLMTA